MSADSRFRRLLRGAFGPVVQTGLVAALAVPAVVVLGQAHGLPRSRPQLTGSGAWLASPSQGVLTLLDGAAEQIVGSVRVPGATAGGQLSAVQNGSSAYAVQPTQGTVSFVDGRTYAVGTPVRFGGGGPAGSLQVYPGDANTYVVDGRRQVASVVDPITLRVRRELALTAQPGPGQSVVDSAGRLWVVGSRGLSWFDGAGGHVRAGLGGARSRLVLLGGRAVLVEPDQARAGVVSDTGEVKSWSCLQIGAADDPAALDRVQLLGSASGDRLVAAMPATGTLVAAGIGGDQCGSTVDVGRPGDRFGPLVQTAGYVFVPNWSTGHTAVVDMTELRKVADLDIGRPGARLELLGKDGLVFYNDLDGDKAGVIRFDGGRWRSGKSLRKYDPRDVGAGILARSPDNGAKSPDQPKPGQPNPSRPAAPGTSPDPGQPDPGQPDPGQPDPGQPDPGQPDPGQPDPGGGNPDPEPSGGPTPPQPDPPVTLTVRVTGGGSATVAAPAPLNAAVGAVCAAGSSCTYQYRPGTTAVLRIPSTAGTVVFDHVTGCTAAPADATGTTCRVTMTAAVTVTAVFVASPPAQARITISRTMPPNSVLSAGPHGGPVNRCDSGCSFTVAPGTVIDMSVHPGADEVIDDWGVAGCPALTLTCSFQAATDRTVRVHGLPPQELDITTVGTGTVAGDVTCSANPCQAFVQFGRLTRLQAFPSAGFRFSSWQGCTPTATPEICALTMGRGPVAVRATFIQLDTTAPVVTITHAGTVVGVGTGNVLLPLPDFTTPFTVTATATDPQSAVTGIEITLRFSVRCQGQLLASHAPAVVASAQGDTTSHTFDPTAHCNGANPYVSLFIAYTAHATSEGGTSTETDQLQANRVLN